jgi:hypothetical protein
MARDQQLGVRLEHHLPHHRQPQPGRLDLAPTEWRYDAAAFRCRDAIDGEALNARPELAVTGGARSLSIAAVGEHS